MRWICLLALLVLPSLALGEVAGKIVGHEGKVTLFRQGGVRGEALTGDGVPVAVGDVIVTHGAARAWLLFGADRILLMEDSSLRISGIDQTSVEGGKVLFDIRKRPALQGIRVLGPTATIGVKGTRFAVLRDGAALEIYLQEGVLEVQPLAGKFQKFRALREDFERMREAMRTEYETAREKLRQEFERASAAMRQGDMESVASFAMEAGTAFRIVGQEVRPLEFSAIPEGEFRLLDAFPDN